MPFAPNQPLIDSNTLPLFETADTDAISRYGSTVRAVMMSNTDYAYRHRKLSSDRKMMPPPSHSRIFGGYLVVRKLGQADEYETWMPDHAFESLYVACSGNTPDF